MADNERTDRPHDDEVQAYYARIRRQLWEAQERLEKAIDEGEPSSVIQKLQRARDAAGYTGD